jgi:cytoskeleton protein RodZ
MNETGNTMSSEWAEDSQGASSSGAAPGGQHGADSAPGKILAAQREAMGWTVEQVADQLKLAVRQVVALEAGDSSALPGPAVVRGFVRAYAKIVRLDPAPLVAQIPLDTPGPSDASHTTLRHARPASFSEVRFPSHGKRSKVPVVPIIGIVVLAGAAFAAWHFGLVSKITGKSDTTTASSTLAPASGTSSTTVLAPASTVAAPASTAAPASSVAVPNLQNPSVPLISVPPPSAVTPGSPAAAPAGAVAVPATPAAAPAAAAPGANALVLTAQKDSWIQVKPASGAPLLSRLVKAGSTETVEVTEPVTLTVGNPAAVSATLRGAAVALPVSRSGAVAKVELK